MKRLKRNRIQRAFDKGYQLGLAGRSKDAQAWSTGTWLRFRARVSLLVAFLRRLDRHKNRRMGPLVT